MGLFNDLNLSVTAPGFSAGLKSGGFAGTLDVNGMLGAFGNGDPQPSPLTPSTNRTANPAAGSARSIYPTQPGAAPIWRNPLVLIGGLAALLVVFLIARR